MARLNSFQIAEAFGGNVDRIYKEKLENEYLEFSVKFDEFKNKNKLNKDYDFLVELFLETHGELLKSIEHMEKIIKIKNRKIDLEYRIYDLDILKEIPIENLFDFESISKNNRRKYVSCPFHSDRTPSMIINENNTFKCFSCGKYGSNIDFIMNLNNINFNQAIKYLQEIEK